MQFRSRLSTMINSMVKSWFTKVSEFLVVMEVSKINENISGYKQRNY